MQTDKQNGLQVGGDVTRLTARQIKAICLRAGWSCQMQRIPIDLIEVDRRIVCSPHYRRSNAVMVCSSTEIVWQCLGWRWDIEDLNEKQIVELLKALEQDSNNELSGSCGTTGTHA